MPPKSDRKKSKGPRGPRSSAADDADEFRAPRAEDEVEEKDDSGAEEDEGKGEAGAPVVAYINLTSAADAFNDASSSKVHIRVHKRNGRSFITTIQGLAEDLDLKKILKAFRRNFHCNGALVQDKEQGEVIQLQGDQRLLVKEFLIDEANLICREDDIVIHGY